MLVLSTVSLVYFYYKTNGALLVPAPERYGRSSSQRRRQARLTFPARWVKKTGADWRFMFTDGS